jgi:hypothetical protein
LTLRNGTRVAAMQHYGVHCRICHWEERPRMAGLRFLVV